MSKQKHSQQGALLRAYHKMVGPKPSLLRGIYDLIAVYLDRGIARSSAALSYYLIFTFFPLLIMANAILSLANETPDAILTAIAHYLPEEVSDLLSSYLVYVSQNNSVALLVASVALILTSASAAFRVIMRSNDEIFRQSALSSVVRMIISVVMPLLLILVMYLSVVTLLTGSWFIHFLERTLGFSLHLNHWGWMRFLVMFCMIFFFLALLYRITLPGNRAERRAQKYKPPVLLGAFCASVALVLASILFSFFISMSSKYSFVYGSLASLLVLMLWLFLISNVLFLGNILNYVVYHHHMARKTGHQLKDL